MTYTNEPHRAPWWPLIGLMTIIIIVLSVKHCQAQLLAPDWMVDKFAAVSFSQDKMIHPLQGDAYQIHTDNVWMLMAGWIDDDGLEYKWAWYFSGHERIPFWSNPSSYKNGIRSRNRNGSGIYFEHPLPWVRLKHMSLSVGHRFKIFGDPHGEPGTLWQVYIPTFNVTVPIYESEGKFKVLMKGSVLHRYRCATVNFGGYITF